MFFYQWTSLFHIPRTNFKTPLVKHKTKILLSVETFTFVLQIFVNNTFNKLLSHVHQILCMCINFKWYFVIPIYRKAIDIIDYLNAIDYVKPHPTKFKCSNNYTNTHRHTHFPHSLHVSDLLCSCGFYMYTVLIDILRPLFIEYVSKKKSLVFITLSFTNHKVSSDIGHFIISIIVHECLSNSLIIKVLTENEFIFVTSIWKLGITYNYVPQNSKCSLHWNCFQCKMLIKRLKCHNADHALTKVFKTIQVQYPNCWSWL